LVNNGGLVFEILKINLITFKCRQRWQLDACGTK